MNPFGSDKPFHHFAGKTYLDVYDAHLRDIEVTSLLEIGVYKGESLRMWKDAFPSARIVGLDIDPACGRPEGCEVVIGSQGDKALLAGLGEFDVIVDDGSHINTLTRTAFKELWPKVRPNGMYVIEDTGCSYEDLTEVSQTWPGMRHVTGSRRNQRWVLESMLMKLVREMDYREGNVSEVQFTSQMCVIRKVP